MPQRHGELRTDRWTPAHFESASDPTVNDDSADGFEIGALWVNTVADTVWACTDATAGAAVWKDVTAVGAGLGDGDKGDITVSGVGTVWTIDNDVVTYAKMQPVSAGDKVLGRISGSGDVEEIDCTAAGRALLDDANAAAQRTTLGLGTIATVNSPVPIANGGTGQTTAVPAFDALAPTTTQGDVIFHDGSDNVRLPKGTAGQVLRMNAGATAPEWGAPGGGTSNWTTIIKAANETIQSDQVVGADASLSFTTVANTNYLIRMMVIYTSPAAADFKYIFTHGGTTTDSMGGSWRLADGDTAFRNVLGDADPLTGENLQTTTDTELNMMWIHVFIRVGASGGTFAFNWAQNTSTAADTTVFAGSFMEYLAETP